jgi:hypothetical protein
MSRPTRREIDRYIAAHPRYHAARAKRLEADLRAIDYDNLSDDEQRREVDRLTREAAEETITRASRWTRRRKLRDR